MAYDRDRKEEIDAMPLGELIHTMISEFDPHYGSSAHLQSPSYFWASERLNEYGIALTNKNQGGTDDDRL